MGEERVWADLNGFSLQTRVMLPQKRKETLEDAMLNRNIKSTDGQLMHRFRLKLNDAINSVSCYSEYFTEELCQTAESLYIEEKKQIYKKDIFPCQEFEAETKLQRLERLVFTDIIALVKCLVEFRSLTASHGGMIK